MKGLLIPVRLRDSTLGLFTGSMPCIFRQDHTGWPTFGSTFGRWIPPPWTFSTDRTPAGLITQCD